MAERKPGWSFRSDQVAFVLTVAVSLLPSLINLRGGTGTWRWWAFLGCGLVFGVAGLVDHTVDDARRRAWRLTIYFSLQTLLLAGIFSITRLNGMSVLVAFPLVGQAVLCLSARVAGVFVTALYLGVMTGSVLMGGTKDAIMGGASVLAGFFFVVVFTRIALREKTARAEAERLSSELTEANVRLQAQAAYVEELAGAKERNRVAREIHDSLGHALTTMAVQLEVAEAMHGAAPPRSLEAVKQAHLLAGEALADVRRSVGALRAEAAKPLPERMRELATGDERLAVQFIQLGATRLLSPEVEHGLFRVAQEGLTNVRKHAAAKTAAVTLDYRSGQRVSVSVSDDGRGNALASAGYGLTGLKERAVLLGGLLTAADRPEGGFVLRLEVPA